MSTNLFTDQSQAVWIWWKSLQPGEDGRFRGDRATLARLRRVSSIMEAAADPATAELFRKLGFEQRFAEGELPRAALIAAVLAHVRDDSKEKLARAIGTPRGGEGTTALVSPLRLKRMIAAREGDELLIAFRRAIAIMGHAANVRDVARQLLLWTDDRTADSARTRFTFEYHNAGDAAPDLKSA